MKLGSKILAAVSVAAVLAGNPLFAGEGKSFKEKVVIEDETKWWGASLSTGWDSLYMFRGANVLRGDMSYGSGIYWTDLNFTWNITDSDFLTVGSWVAFGTQKTDYKEVDIYTTYTKTFGDLALSFGYIFYYVWSAPLYSHELNVSAAYTFDLGFMTVTPSLSYFFNLGPNVAEEGLADSATSYLLAKIAGSIPVIGDAVSIDPWISFGTNFDYNVDENLNQFVGANDLQVGIGVPWAINDTITLYGYGAYSYAWENLFGTTRPNTFWGGAKVIFSF
ncbi:MAG: hypothetical protein Fur0032_17310 [Terrimicrobiaceae bacterium]